MISCDILNIVACMKVYRMNIYEKFYFYLPASRIFRLLDENKTFSRIIILTQMSYCHSGADVSGRCMSVLSCVI